MIYGKELEWIHQLQNALRSPWMDRFFLGWDYVDKIGFVILLVTIVWYLIDRRIGIRLLYILLLNAVFNHFLKIQFDLPRPCQIDSTVGLICSSSPGFPSGAAQTAILYAGILYIECKNSLYRILGIVFAFFLCFSRVYLGVHFFIDILGGLIAGVIPLMIYWKIFPLVEPKWKKYVFLFPFLLLALGKAKALFSFGISIGLAIGLFLNEKERVDGKKSWPTRALQVAVVLLGMVACLAGKKHFPALTVFFGVMGGFWASYLGAWLVQKIKIKK